RGLAGLVGGADLRALAGLLRIRRAGARLTAGSGRAHGTGGGTQRGGAARLAVLLTAGGGALGGGARGLRLTSLAAGRGSAALRLALRGLRAGLAVALIELGSQRGVGTELFTAQLLVTVGIDLAEHLLRATALPGSARGSRRLQLLVIELFKLFLGKALAAVLIEFRERFLNTGLTLLAGGLALPFLGIRRAHRQAKAGHEKQSTG